MLPASISLTRTTCQPSELWTGALTAPFLQAEDRPRQFRQQVFPRQTVERQNLGPGGGRRLFQALPLGNRQLDLAGGRFILHQHLIDGPPLRRLELGGAGIVGGVQILVRNRDILGDILHRQLARPSACGIPVR